MSNKNPTQHTRWHRYDSEGNKEIKKFPTNYDPNCTRPENGYTEWNRGTGKLSPETYEKVTSSVRNAVKGKKLSDETKQKMREAKLGVKKSKEHKENLAKAWRQRKNQQYQDLLAILRAVKED